MKLEKSYVRIQECHRILMTTPAGWLWCHRGLKMLDLNEAHKWTFDRKHGHQQVTTRAQETSGHTSDWGWGGHSRARCPALWSKLFKLLIWETWPEWELEIINHCLEKGLPRSPWVILQPILQASHILSSLLKHACGSGILRNVQRCLKQKMILLRPEKK